MRKIFIDLSSDNYLQQPKMFGGYEGEHNETYLQVKLPKRMIDIECSGYRFDFQTPDGNKISSPIIQLSEDETLSFHLTQQLTVAGKLIFKAVAVLTGENTVDLISKTNTVILCIEDSPKGNVQLLDPNGYKDELLEMIDARILEINPSEVDQTYNPESQNAQSGFAVAEAVSIKMDKFGEVYDEGRNINLNQEDQTAFHGYEIALHAYKRLLLIGETVTLNNNKLSDVGNPINNTDAANKQYVDNLIGDIETALDNIIALQNSLIGGEVV